MGKTHSVKSSFQTHRMTIHRKALACFLFIFCSDNDQRSLECSSKAVDLSWWSMEFTRNRHFSSNEWHDSECLEPSPVYLICMVIPGVDRCTVKLRSDQPGHMLIPGLNLAHRGLYVGYVMCCTLVLDAKQSRWWTCKWPPRFCQLQGDCKFIQEVASFSSCRFGIRMHLLNCQGKTQALLILR